MGINNPLSISTLVAIQAVGFAAAEGARAQEPDAEKRKYPGGAFNPAGMAADETSKLKELKNGEEGGEGGGGGGGGDRAAAQ
jgi:light-harvesting complex I chlorophyll a/b binding protein 1